MADEQIEERDPAPVRWVTVDAACAGMVLARPVVVAQQGVMSLTIAAGAVLTADMLVQLMTRGVECVGIEGEPSQDSEESLRRRQMRCRRLEAIFGDERERLESARQELFDALLAGGS